MTREADSRLLILTLPISREEREEAQWIARAQAGEEAAYRWLLAQYRPRVVRLATHTLRRAGDAEDAAQEAFIRAFRYLHGFRGETRFAAWLYRIAVRVCLDWRRRRSDTEEPLEDSLPTGASETAADSETRLLIESLLDRLSPPMRAALALREIEGLEYAEIAQILGLPLGTVRSRLHAARAQFRELWAAALQEEQDV